MLKAKIRASLRIRAVSQEPMQFAHVSSKPRENFFHRTRHVDLLKGRACALKDCFDGMFEEFLFFSRRGSNGKHYLNWRHFHLLACETLLMDLRRIR